MFNPSSILMPSVIMNHVIWYLIFEYRLKLRIKQVINDQFQIFWFCNYMNYTHKRRFWHVLIYQSCNNARTFIILNLRVISHLFFYESSLLRHILPCIPPRSRSVYFRSRGTLLKKENIQTHSRQTRSLDLGLLVRASKYRSCALLSHKEDTSHAFDPTTCVHVHAN